MAHNPPQKKMDMCGKPKAQFYHYIYILLINKIIPNFNIGSRFYSSKNYLLQ